MNEEEYLKRIRRALWGIDKRKREEIVLELKSEIDERLSSGEKFEKIILDLPQPEELRREYEEIYGSSMMVKSLFVIFALVLSIFSLPVIPFTSWLFYGAPAILAILAIFLFYISSHFGMYTGFLASSLSASLRFILIYLTSLSISLENGTVISEGITSLIILLIPLLAKKRK